VRKSCLSAELTLTLDSHDSTMIYRNNKGILKEYKIFE